MQESEGVRDIYSPPPKPVTHTHTHAGTHTNKQRQIYPASKQLCVISTHNAKVYFSFDITKYFVLLIDTRVSWVLQPVHLLKTRSTFLCISSGEGRSRSRGNGLTLPDEWDALDARDAAAVCNCHAQGGSEKKVNFYLFIDTITSLLWSHR